MLIIKCIVIVRQVSNIICKNNLWPDNSCLYEYNDRYLSTSYKLKCNWVTETYNYSNLLKPNIYISSLQYAVQDSDIDLEKTIQLRSKPQSNHNTHALTECPKTLKFDSFGNIVMVQLAEIQLTVAYKNKILRNIKVCDMQKSNKSTENKVTCYNG